jgi:murein L,D-transpeptidase YafK
VLLLLGFLLGLPVTAGSARAQQPTVATPTSDRSLEVTARVGPLWHPRVSQLGVPWGSPLYLRVFKQESLLEAWILDPATTTWHLLHTWPICAWSGTLGPKLAEGDRQSPEGFYAIPPPRMNPNSRWHLAMNVGFPNDYDRRLGRTGSWIMIHGVCGSSGCYAMTDRGVEGIWVLVEAALQHGQPWVPVHIFPFRMTPENLHDQALHPWFPFWANLAEGWRFFDETGQVPEVDVGPDGRYRFRAPSVDGVPRRRRP